MASALGSSPSPPSFFSSLSSVFSSFLSSDLLSLSLLASADFFSAVSSWPVALAAALAVTSSPCCATALASFGVSMYYCQPCANLPSLRALGRRRTLACSAACFSWFTPGASSALGAPPVLGLLGVLLRVRLLERRGQTSSAVLVLLVVGLLRVLLRVGVAVSVHSLAAVDNPGALVLAFGPGLYFSRDRA